MPNSYNGWPASPDKSELDVIPFGDARALPFPGGVRAGDVWKVLGYVCVQLHERVEECVGGWDWGYTYKANVNNPSTLSCHSSGTAVDYNAPLHPNGSSNTFTDAQKGEIYAILDEVAGAVNWLEGYDEMHFEICVDAGTLADIAASLPTVGDEIVTDDDVERIARAVWQYAVSYAKQTNDPKDPEDSVTEPAAKVLSAAASYAGRASKR